MLNDDDRRPCTLKPMRGGDGRPVRPCTHRAPEDSRIVTEGDLGEAKPKLKFHAKRPRLPDKPGEYASNARSSLAIAQLLLLWHLLEAWMRALPRVPFRTWAT